MSFKHVEDAVRTWKEAWSSVLRLRFSGNLSPTCSGSTSQ